MTTATASTGGSGLLPARPLAAQAHALRAAAAFIEQAGIAGLSLTIDPGQITIQVPVDLAGQPGSRRRGTGRRSRRPGGPRGPPRPDPRLDLRRRADRRPPRPHLHRHRPRRRDKLMTAASPGPAAANDAAAAHQRLRTWPT